MKKSSHGSLVLGLFGRFTSNWRVEGETIYWNRSLEARIVIRSIFHGCVYWQTPLLFMAQLLQFTLVHYIFLISFSVQWNPILARLRFLIKTTWNASRVFYDHILSMFLLLYMIFLCFFHAEANQFILFGVELVKVRSRSLIIFLHVKGMSKMLAICMSTISWRV